MTQNPSIKTPHDIEACLKRLDDNFGIHIESKERFEITYEREPFLGVGIFENNWCVDTGLGEVFGSIKALETLELAIPVLKKFIQYQEDYKKVKNGR